MAMGTAGRHLACSLTKPGHAVHYLQMRHKDDPNQIYRQVRLTQVDADGYLTFDDGSRWWNHDPVRLVHALGDGVARLNEGGLLLAPGGAFCLSGEATPEPSDELGEGKLPIGPAPAEGGASGPAEETKVRAQVKADYEEALKLLDRPSAS